MIGTTISHYRIIEKLGEGGMGVVYKAEDLQLGRTVALKFLPSNLTSDPIAKDRFINEAKAASALDHPNVCTIYEINETEEGQLFIAMAYYDGETLKGKIASEQLPAESAVDIAIQIAQGLEGAHEAGITHRDIKPANIMITRRGKVKIVDFGLAILAGQSRLTKTGPTPGTVSYMSYEQVRGEDVDQRSDIWSLGVVLYEMLTGQLPFPGEHEHVITYAILTKEPEPVLTLRSEVLEKLELIVIRCLQKNPANRYQTMGELLADLRAVKTGHQVDEATAHQLRPPAKGNHFLRIGAILTILVVLLAALGYYFFRPSHAIDSLAVLPFENLSGDPEQEYWVDGIHDELITNLAKIKALTVISRTSVMQYKQTTKPLPQIAKELNVEAVVEGTVRREGDRARITVQLIDAAKDRHLWANSYERDLTNILLLQSEVAQAVAKEIKIAVSPKEERLLAGVRQVAPEAYDAYLKGIYFLDKSQWKMAVEQLQSVIAIDAEYAPAHAAMARAYMWIALNFPLERTIARDKARQSAQKAVELDTNLERGHAILGEISLLFDWDWAKAETEITRALELNPSYSDAHGSYSTYLSLMGRYNESIAEAQRAVQLNPFSINSYGALVWAYFYDGQHSRAIEMGMLLEELVQGGSLQPLCYICAAAGRYDEAIEAAKQLLTITLPFDVPDQFAKAHWHALLGGAYALSGQRKLAFEMLAKTQEIAQRQYVSPYSFTYIYACLGMTDEFFEWWERAYQERNPRTVFNLPIIKTSPIFEFARNDPRFENMWRKFNLPE